MTRILTRVRGVHPPTPSRWIPIGLAAAAVLCQIAYPLATGADRDRLTMAVVVLFAGASLTHAWTQRGLRPALVLAGVFAGGGLAAELVGTATGFPFGTYTYAAERLGPAIGDVPLVIPLAWSMMGYPALVVARLIARSALVGIPVGALALTTWDLYLDPQMVAEGYWAWAGDGPHLIGTIPLTNYAGWLLVSALMVAVLWPLTRDWAPEARDDRVPVALYVWTWVGSALAHAVFLDLPQSALYGAIGMGGVVGLLVVACSRPLVERAAASLDAAPPHPGGAAL